MGRYDVPAEIEYITKLKNESSLMYIGHSMGTTIFYAMASERPDIASKVKAMFGLAPVAFTDHMRGPFYLLGSALRRAQVYKYCYIKNYAHIHYHRVICRRRKYVRAISAGIIIFCCKKL